MDHALQYVLWWGTGRRSVSNLAITVTPIASVVTVSLVNYSLVDRALAGYLYGNLRAHTSQQVVGDVWHGPSIRCVFWSLSIPNTRTLPDGEIICAPRPTSATRTFHNAMPSCSFGV